MSCIKRQSERAHITDETEIPLTQDILGKINSN